MWQPCASTSILLLKTLLSQSHIQKAVKNDRNNVRGLIDKFHHVQNNMEPSTIRTLQLENFLIDILRALGSTMENIIYDVLDLLKPVFPNEVPQIRQHLIFLNIEEKSKVANILLKGAVQSGKTTMILLFALCYQLVGMDVVILLRNKTDDKIQFENRQTDLLKHNCLRNIQIKGNCYPVILHKGNIQKVAKNLDFRARPYALVVDEADLRTDKSTDSFNLLFTRARQTIFVSATVQDICFEKFDISRQQILNFCPPQGYRGLRDITCITYPKIKPISILWEILHDEEYKQARIDHPRIILISTEFRNADIKMMVEQVNCIPSENLWIIEYTGENGIELTIPNGVHPPDGIKPPKNNIITYNNGSISQMLYLMAKCGGAEQFQNIVIIAGRMADRGINFSSYDSKNFSHCWHITHQILDKSETSSCANLTQSLRMLGVHNDTIPLKLYTTEHIASKIRQSNQLCDELINATIDPAHNFYEEKGEYLHEIVPQIPVYKRTIAPNFLSRRPVKALNLNPNSGIGYKPPNGNNLEDKEKAKIAPNVDLFIQPMTYKIPDNLRNERQRIYNLVIQHIPETGKWFERARVIEKFASVDKSAPVRGTMHFMAMENGIPANEGTKGLLFKKSGDRWYVRLNY